MPSLDRRRTTLLMLMLSAAGCGDPRSTPDRDASTTMDAAMSSDGGTNGRDAGSPRDGAIAPTDGGSGPRIAVCQLGCVTTSDCVTASPAFDADNYRCESGACRYTGCVSDAECRSTFSNDRYVCRDLGTGIPTCLLGCTTSAECSTGAAAFDEDNYGCASGVCVYQGCNDDEECAATFAGPYGCRDVAPPTTPVPIPVASRNCVRLCTNREDCATDSAAFDGDNYECRSGACVYVGCHDDAECSTSLSSDAYICR